MRCGRWQRRTVAEKRKIAPDGEPGNVMNSWFWRRCPAPVAPLRLVLVTIHPRNQRSNKNYKLKDGMCTQWERKHWYARNIRAALCNHSQTVRRSEDVYALNAEQAVKGHAKQAFPYGLILNAARLPLPR